MIKIVSTHDAISLKLNETTAVPVILFEQLRDKVRRKRMTDSWEREKNIGTMREK